jgi:YidC/Oxa1 family membrane protein insertase
MNDIRRTILWVIFGFSLVLLWDQWQVFNGNKPTFLPSSKPAAVATAPAGSTPAAGSGVPTASTAGGSAAAVPTQAAPAAPREQVSVTTDLFKAVIDSEGATVNHLELRKYEEADRTQHVVLFENGSPATRYVAQTGLLSQTGEPFPNHLTPMAPKAGPREMAEGQNTLEVSFESAPSGGLKYVKTYVFKRGDYTINVRHDVVNVSDQPRDAQLYMQLLRHGTVAGHDVRHQHLHRSCGLHRREEVPEDRLQGHRQEQDRASSSPPATGWLPWCSITSPAPGCSRATPPARSAVRA